MGRRGGKGVGESGWRMLPLRPCESLYTYNFAQWWVENLELRRWQHFSTYDVSWGSLKNNFTERNSESCRQLFDTSNQIGTFSVSWREHWMYCAPNGCKRSLLKVNPWCWSILGVAQRAIRNLIACTSSFNWWGVGRFPSRKKLSLNQRGEIAR